ncbi:hypothetical protein CHLRE_12g515301v5 [Chlamydomonas reinhardtii]|uniref:Integral membrane bound transporter domain-containing protein n=1 Tax=Chlamydomonas reinhardtii TaxID=3055 RepID=A0A2K3D3S1_CHLRE|nr:uncharacterized protein CHLRE_12g515301v5 [Chlamydomonas reinhardtii]PNW75159.1 hypothetical protein CHLRE_12g515301v5 [Chlamydomonas reinhardtii]
MVVVARPAQPSPPGHAGPGGGSRALSAPPSAAAGPGGHLAAAAAAAAAAVAAAAARLGEAGRGFVLSAPFQTAVQLVAGELVTGLFVVVRPLAFPTSCLAPALYSAWTVLFSPDNHLGSRLQAGAVVAAAMSWGAVMGGVVLSLALGLVPAAGSHLHTGVLCVLALAVLPVLAANRATLGPSSPPFMWVAGSTSSLAYGVVLLTGQPLGSVAAVWSGVVRNLVLVGFLGGGCGGLMAAAVLPSLAAHELREDTAAVVRGAGHAITRIASRALQPQPEICWSAEGWRPAPSATLSRPGSPAPASLSPAHAGGWSRHADGGLAAEDYCSGGGGGRVHTMAMPSVAGAARTKLDAASHPAAAPANPAPAGPLEADPVAPPLDTPATPPGSGTGRATPAVRSSGAAGDEVQPTLPPADEASSSSSADEDALHPLHVSPEGRSGGAAAAAASPAAAATAASGSAHPDAHELAHLGDDGDDDGGGHEDEEAQDALDDDAFLQMLQEASEPSLLANAYASAYAGPQPTAGDRRRSSVSVLERVSVATVATADTVVGWWWRLRVRARLWTLRLRRCCCGSRAEAAAAERTLSLPVFVAPPGGLRPSPAVAAAATALAAHRHRKAVTSTWRPRPAPATLSTPQQHQQAPAAHLGRASVLASAAQQQEQQQQPVGSGERVGAVGGGGGVGQAAAVAWAPVSVLRPLLGRARQCVASARLEPPWCISGPRDLDRWSRLLSCCEVLVGRVEALGALLEHRGRRAVPLGDPHLSELLGGGDVVGPYRVAHARAAAACAAISSALTASATGPQGHRSRSSSSSSRRSSSSSSCMAWLRGKSSRQTAAVVSAAGAEAPAAAELLPVVTDWEAVRRELKAAVRCGFRGYWGRLRAVAASAAAAAADEEAVAAGDGVQNTRDAAAAGVPAVLHADAGGSGGAAEAQPSPASRWPAQQQQDRQRRVPILGIEQARALMFMWAVSDGVLAAVAEMEAAARDLLAQPAAAAPASRAAPATSSTAAAAPELSGTAPLPHTGQAPLQQQQHHSSLAPALVRNPDALPPEGPLGRSAGDTTASGMRSMSGTSGSATVTAGHIAGVSSTVGTSSPSAQPPPALKGPALRLRRLRQAAVAQARAVGVWLEREFGWAWRVLQIAVGWQVVATSAAALATSPRLLLEVARYGLERAGAAAHAGLACARHAATRRPTTSGLRTTTARNGVDTAAKAAELVSAAGAAAAPSSAPPPLWSSRFFQFGCKYWLTCGAVLVGTLGVSARPELAPLMRRYPPMYGYIASCVAMTERVESTASRVVLRLLGTLAGGALGLAALLHSQLANSPPALLGLVCGATFPVACLCGNRFKPAIVLTLVTLSAMTLCHQPRTAGGSSNTVRGDSDTAQGVALRLFAARVTSVSLGCTLPLLVSRMVLPWYTSDWALETMAGAFEGCERLTRQLYTQFYEEGYRAHVAARGRQATDTLLQQWGLPAASGVVVRTPAGGEQAATAATTTTTTTAKELQALVVGPLVSVQRSLLRDAAVWTRGTLATPEVVAALLRALLPLADRLAALQLVVAETPPLVHGHLSGWAFEAIVLPMHADMQAMLDALHQVVVASRALLVAEHLQAARSSGASSIRSSKGPDSGGSGVSSRTGAGGVDGHMHGRPQAGPGDSKAEAQATQMSPRAALSAAVHSLDLARLQVRRRLRGMRRAFHAAVLALDEQRLPYATHPDDAVRVNAMLFALVQVLDRSTAAARCLAYARRERLQPKAPAAR